MNEACAVQAVRHGVLGGAGDRGRLVVGAILSVRQKAPQIAWYLVAEELAPIGRTCWLGIE